MPSSKTSARSQEAHDEIGFDVEVEETAGWTDSGGLDEDSYIR
jgi:hypothetical protein